MGQLINLIIYGGLWRYIWNHIIIHKPKVIIEPIGEKLYSRVISSTIASKNASGVGCSGKYYQISLSKGIKILYPDFYAYNEAIESNSYKEALDEASMLRKARSKFSNIPKCYGVRVVSRIGSLGIIIFKIGIVMQHLGSTTADSIIFDEDEGESLKYDMQKQLNECGIFHKDLHLNNIMKWKDEWWVIDLDAQYVSLT